MTKLGFIGVGNIGGVMVRDFRKLGHEARIANSRGPETLKELAEEIGAIASTVEEVILKDLFAQLSPNVIVVDVGSYIPVRDGPIAGLDAVSVSMVLMLVLSQSPGDLKLVELVMVVITISLPFL
eukprot:gene44197-54940_t